MTNRLEEVEHQIQELEQQEILPEFAERHKAAMEQLRADEFTVANCQGNLIRSYNMAVLRHLVVRVEDAAAARQFLLDATGDSGDVHQVTTGANWERRAKPKKTLTGHSPLLIPVVHDQELEDRRSPTADTWDGKPATCLNVGITAKGLTALGLDDESFNTFPEEFRQGAASRAKKVGDVDGSAPNHWRDGFDDEDKVHLMWTVHAGTKPNLEAACDDLEKRWDASGAFSITSCLDGAKLLDEDDNPTHDVHFGYRDDISQPRFEMLRLDKYSEGEARYDPQYYGDRDNQPLVPVGALLQIPDAATSFDEVRWQLPALVDRKGRKDDRLSHFGCYNAFRVMEQDVDAFEEFLEREAASMNPPWNKEYLAAKLMGRWRNGVPIVSTPDHDTWSRIDAEMPQLEQLEHSLNAFDYASDNVVKVEHLGRVDDGENEISGMVVEPLDGMDDPEGASCPVGSHIRRSNPRRGRIVQRSANHTRQIVRRGMPYGPRFDNKKRNDGHQRGLLGSFFCGSLIGQFESMMYDWINLGLQDPRITGTNCPIVGANDPATSRFDIPIAGRDPVTIRRFPRFVQTVGAAYFFYPGVPGLRLLGAMN